MFSAFLGQTCVYYIEDSVIDVHCCCSCVSVGWCYYVQKHMVNMQNLNC